MNDEERLKLKIYIDIRDGLIDIDALVIASVGTGIFCFFFWI